MGILSIIDGFGYRRISQNIYWKIVGFHHLSFEFDTKILAYWILSKDGEKLLWKTVEIPDNIQYWDFQKFEASVIRSNHQYEVSNAASSIPIQVFKY